MSSQKWCFASIVLGVLLLSSCQNDEDNTPIEQDFSNKLVYNISVGDTVKIFQQSVGGVEFSNGLKMDDLSHVEFTGVENFDTGNLPDCAGCTNTFAYVLIGKSVGIDTIFDELQGAVKPEMDTLTTYSHIIRVK